MRRRICVVITARPSYSRIKSALECIRQTPNLELQLVVGASALLDKYGSLIDVMRADGFEPNAQVYMVIEGENLVTSAKSTGIGIVELATSFDNLKPHAVLTVADRYETIATAIAASYLNIPVVHTQGGEVTGSIDEKVRHAVTKLSNLHFVSNQQAADRIRKMGEDPTSIFITGCPSIDLASRVKQQRGFLKQEDLRRGVGADIDPSEAYIVVLQHPVTFEWKDAENQVSETLEAIRELKFPTYWFWPNIDPGSDASSRGIRKYREKHDVTTVRFLKNLPPEQFLELLMDAKCLIGNSSAGIREAAFLGVPSVNIGTRQFGRDRGPNVIDVDYDRNAILEATSRQIKHGGYQSSQLYGDGLAGERIARYLTEVNLPIDKCITY